MDVTVQEHVDFRMIEGGLNIEKYMDRVCQGTDIDRIFAEFMKHGMS